MRSAIWKVLAIAMATALVSCAGAACTQMTSTSSEASVKVESVEDESKTESEDADESEEEGSDESETEDTDESEDEGSEAEDEGSEAEDESSEDEGDDSGETAEITEADVVGSWEFNAGSAYKGYIINEGGTLEYRNVNGYTISGTWEIENGVLRTHVLGGLEEFTVEETQIVSKDAGTIYLKVDNLALEDKTQLIIEASVVGEWNCETDDPEVASHFILEEGGKGYYQLESGDKISATWEVVDGVVNVRAAGGLETFIYSDLNTPVLIDSSNEARIFNKVG